MSECVECGSAGKIHQHHTNYEDDETVPLCPSCHRIVHSDESHDLYPVDENPSNITSIPIDSETRDRLRAEKQGGETYSETIERVLDERNEARDELDVLKFEVGE